MKSNILTCEITQDLHDVLGHFKLKLLRLKAGKNFKANLDLFCSQPNSLVNSNSGFEIFGKMKKKCTMHEKESML